MPSKAYEAFTKKAMEERMVANMPDLSAGPPTLPDDFRAPVPELPAGYTGGEVTLRGVRGLFMTRPGVRAEAYKKMQQWNFENCRIIPVCESTRCTAWNSAKISSVYFTNPGRPVVTYIHFA